MDTFVFKESKESLKRQSDIKKASAWAMKVLNRSGYKVGMSMESLKEVDRFFNEQMDDTAHTPKQGGLLSENTQRMLFAIGSLIGEVVINEYGGRWLTDDNDSYDEADVALLLCHNIIHPVQRVIKRCDEGSENDIHTYAVLADGLEERATKERFKKRQRMPRQNETFTLNRALTKDEFELLIFGLVSHTMDDRWFIYYDEGKLYIHRSWTGMCVYIACIDQSGDGYNVGQITVNRNKKQYTKTDIAYDKKVVNVRINDLLEINGETMKKYKAINKPF